MQCSSGTAQHRLNRYRRQRRRHETGRTPWKPRSTRSHPTSTGCRPGCVAPPAGFTFNQFLVRDEEPFLFHTGMRAAVPARVRSRGARHPLDRAALDLLPRRGRRVRRNEPVSRPPPAQCPRRPRVHVSLNDLADRPPRGGRRRGRSTSAASAAVRPDAARPAQLGERALVRRDDLDHAGG